LWCPTGLEAGTLHVYKKHVLILLETSLRARRLSKFEQRLSGAGSP
jgi:hypothetical protein